MPNETAATVDYRRKRRRLKVLTWRRFSKLKLEEQSGGFGVLDFHSNQITSRDRRPERLGTAYVPQTLKRRLRRRQRLTTGSLPEATAVKSAPVAHRTRKDQTLKKDNCYFAFAWHAIYHELVVFWDFTWRDWSASLIPGMMYTTAALRSGDSNLSSSRTMSNLACSFCYFLLYIYSFDIANQINGIAEDRVNKPDRPLPSGRVSLQGAYIRWYITTVAYLLLSAAWRVLPWGALGQTLVHKEPGLHDRRSLCLLHASWALVAPLTTREWRWASTLSGVFGVVANIQDMRDVEVALAVSMFYMAFRVLVGCTRKYDHQTYMHYDKYQGPPGTPGTSCYTGG
ncbi:hypothetical protein B0H13DRAFT_1910918 [Mycena leptocephala]|nr:hypothetical protein B0H13DRAFT_1910918 [Mycena leptocephala]